MSQTGVAATTGGGAFRTLFTATSAATAGMAEIASATAANITFFISSPFAFERWPDDAFAKREQNIATGINPLA
jgi:hypothetical protein